MSIAAKRTLKVASCAVVLTLIMSGVALAHDDDDDYYRQGNPQQARSCGYQEGYQNGFRDAYRNTAWNDGYRENYRGDGWPGDDDVAYRFGYDDGATAARSDLELGKSYNS